MKVRVWAFAGLVAMIGAREIEVAVREGATVADVRAAVAAAHPQVEAMLRNVVCAVGEEYVDDGYVVAEGEAVALIPPVSGGRG
jgi:molybdopterin converting factor small subunit